MRITHRYRAYLNLPAADIEAIRISACRRIERQTTRLETRHAHVYRYDTSTQNTRVDEPGWAVHGDGTRGCSSPTVEQSGDTTCTVATLFDFAAIGIEDAIEDRRTRASGLLQDQGLVESDAGTAVAELSSCSADGSACGQSKTMKSLPEPCIFMKSMRMPPRIAESSQRGTIPEHTAIHHGEYSCIDCPLGGSLVNHSIL